MNEPASRATLTVVNPLRDYLRSGLDLVMVGINPGTKSATADRHYAGPGNHFWPLMFESGLISEPLTFAEDERVLEWGIGLTNIVDRPSPSITDLSLAELRSGAASLRTKLLQYQPRIACFNGKRIYEVFAGHPCVLGLQDERLGETRLYVMPSTSARAAAYQRADKLRYFQELAGLVHAGRGTEKTRSRVHPAVEDVSACGGARRDAQKSPLPPRQRGGLGWGKRAAALAVRHGGTTIDLAAPNA